jgi:fibronectin-binding autotransporter adhesin
MKPKPFLRSFLALAGNSLLAVSSANATQFWDGTGSDANWNTPENWGGDLLPAFSTTAINFGSLSSAAGTGFGGVVAPSQTTANNDLTAGALIVGINFGNNGQANRTDAYTLQGNSIAFGNATNQTIGTTALHAAAIVSSIEDVITLDMDLGSPVSAQNRQFQALAKHYLKFDGVISGGANAVVLVRVTDSKVTLTNANNSYLGATNISEGTGSALESVLEITSIANGGGNSSIGASSNAASNLRFNFGFNDTSLTTLRYIGSANASTDRLFALYGNINGTNSRIESSGAGTLSFTNTGEIASGHARGRNFYLGGTNTGDNTFAPTLKDFSVTELSTFTKQGDGKWILTGNHTYTGATTVSGGTLLLGNAAALGFGGVQTTATGATTVASGFTLDLKGTTGINEPITLSGTGIGANGALINSAGTPAIIGDGIAGLAVAATGSGSGFSTVPTVAISGSGTGATATASLGLTTASITSITNGGTASWAVNDTLGISGGGGSGAIATVTSVNGSGQITGLSITNAGYGYTAAPTTLFKITGAGTGTPTITGNATNFTVGGLAMTAAGSGYTGTPTFSFNGSAATVTPTLSSVILAADSSVGGSGDITINAVVSESVAGRALTKVGAGTVELTNTNTYTGATTVAEGTLALGVTDCLEDTSNVVIGAGALNAGAGFTDTAGTLDCTGAATINLGDSSSKLAFANSNGVGGDWAGTLTITGTFVPGNGTDPGNPGSLRFGTDNTGLSVAQLGKISATGWSGFGLDAFGYLTATSGGGITFADWRTANGAGSQTLADDHDGDGVDNGTEFFLFGNTSSTGFTALPPIVNTGGILSVTWAKHANYPGNYTTDFVVQTSDTLDAGSWVTATQGTNPGEVEITGNNIKFTFSAGTRKFARLKVTGPN